MQGGRGRQRSRRGPGSPRSRCILRCGQGGRKPGVGAAGWDGDGSAWGFRLWDACQCGAYRPCIRFRRQLRTKEIYSLRGNLFWRPEVQNPGVQSVTSLPLKASEENLPPRLWGSLKSLASCRDMVPISAPTLHPPQIWSHGHLPHICVPSPSLIRTPVIFDYIYKVFVSK